MSRLFSRIRLRPAGVLFVLAGLALSLAGTPLLAQSRTFPYEATVRSAQVEVRSGPGQRYYITGHVRQDDRVTVVRHDPGGWYMIAPPQGSFSYIEAAVVRKTGNASGVVELSPLETSTISRAIVQIGSELSEDHSYYGRELANGDPVQILGETMLNTDRGPVRMYRITPPDLEYRWVKGDYIVAADGPSAMAAPIQRVAGIVADDAPATRVEPAFFASEPRQVEPPREAPVLPLTGRPRAPSMRQSAAEEVTLSERAISSPRGRKEALVDLDLQYMDQLQKSPEHWDLDQLTREYQALRSHVGPEQQAQIDSRLSAIESRRKIWDEYRDFMRLTRETSERDASLAAQQQGMLQQVGYLTAGGTEATTTRYAPATAEPGMFSPANEYPGTGPAMVGPAMTGPVTTGPVTTGPAMTVSPTSPGQPPLLVPGAASSPLAPMTSAASPVAGTPTPSSTPSVQRLDGAGIVQRLPAGQPGQYHYALTNSQGQMLAVLQAPPAVGVEQHVGRSMGVVGQRYFDPQLKSDVIQVQQILPVQLSR